MCPADQAGNGCIWARAQASCPRRSFGSAGNEKPPTVPPTLPISGKFDPSETMGAHSPPGRIRDALGLHHARRRRIGQTPGMFQSIVESQSCLAPCLVVYARPRVERFWATLGTRLGRMPPSTALPNRLRSRDCPVRTRKPGCGRRGSPYVYQSPATRFGSFVSCPPGRPAHSSVGSRPAGRSFERPTNCSTTVTLVAFPSHPGRGYPGNQFSLDRSAGISLQKGQQFRVAPSVGRNHMLSSVERE